MVFFNVVCSYSVYHSLHNNLNLKLKIDLKMCNFKNLEEIWKPEKSFEKTSGNPEKMIIRLKIKSYH